MLALDPGNRPEQSNRIFGHYGVSFRSDGACQFATAQDRTMNFRTLRGLTPLFDLIAFAVVAQQVIAGMVAQLHWH